MHTTAHLDWLTYTVSGTPPDAVCYEGMLSEFTHTGHGAKGYRALYKAPTGATLATNGEANGHTSVTMAGHALSALRGDKGIDDQTVAKWIVAHGATVPRVDLAINLYDADLTVDAVAKAWNDGRLITRATNALYVRKLKRADRTLYIGSPTSDRLMRVYDKKAEQKLPLAGEWLRIELQCRNKRALTVISALAVQPERAVINRAIKDFCDYPADPEWQVAVRDSNATIDKVQHPLPKTLEWLIGQVAPAMAGYQVQHPEVHVLDILASAYAVELKKRAHAD